MSNPNGSNKKVKRTATKDTVPTSSPLPGLSNDIYMNPISEYEEQVEINGLTLFDIHRKPRPVLPRCQEISLPLKKMNAEFQCPICLEYMKKTLIVMECLHRFCAACIEKCLRMGMKECPSCRIHIPSRRSLRADKDFDELLQSILGDVNKQWEKMGEILEKVNKEKYMNNSNITSRKRAIAEQSRNSKRSGSSQATSVASPALTDVNNANRNVSTTVSHESVLIRFVLRRHPQEMLIDRLHREYLRTSKDITMKHLSKFLKEKLGYPGRARDIQLITVNLEGDGVILRNEQTLEFVRDKIVCKKDVMPNDIVIHYRLCEGSVKEGT